MKLPVHRLVVAVTALSAAVGAPADIYQCPLPDGTVMYSQLPCTDDADGEEAKPTPDHDAESADNEAHADTDSIAEHAVRTDPEAVAACKKRYRDAIDAIDAELRQDYRPELADEYKARLLALTRKLREC